MQIILMIALLIIGGLSNFLIRPKSKFIYTLANGYIMLALTISVGTWLFYFAGIKNGLVIAILSFILYWGKLASYLTLGYLVANIFFARMRKDAFNDSDMVKKINKATLWGGSILTGNIFILATVGKLQNMADMTAFFKSSGYTLWFLYFIMTAETLGGLGILLHLKLKTGPLATACLLLIMAGAVYTHVHNGDPFSDSYAAVIQFITLSLIMMIYYFEKQSGAAPQRAATS